MGKKQGLHGWKAFIAVVLSGGIAGLVVVFLIFSVVRSIFSFSENTSILSNDKTGESVRERKPRESVDVGVIDLCEIVEGKGLISASLSNRVDSDDFYKDGNSPEFDARIVTDNCTWEVVGAGGHLWDFNLSYVAFVEDGISSKEILSEEEFEKRIADASRIFENISNESIGSGEWSAYGDLGNQKVGYILVKKVKTGVFEIRLSGKEGNSVLEKDFRAAVGRASPYLVGAFTAQIPD